VRVGLAHERVAQHADADVRGLFGRLGSGHLGESAALAHPFPPRSSGGEADPIEQRPEYPAPASRTGEYKPEPVNVKEMRFRRSRHEVDLNAGRRIYSDPSPRSPGITVRSGSRRSDA